MFLKCWKILKVLFVSSGNSKAGISPIVRSQGESLKRNGIDLDYFTILGKGKKGYLKNIVLLRNHLKQNRFDIIHAHYALCGWIALLSFCRIPLIVSYMGCDVYGDINQNGKRIGYANILLSQLLQPFVDKIIVKSKNLYAYIYLKNKAYIIPNGVNFQNFRPLEQKDVQKKLKIKNNKTVLFLGNPVDPRKNISLLKKALETLKDGAVTFLNPYPIDPDQVPYYLNAADVLVLTSKLEGSPNLIKEAMACNCPIVSTDVGDVKEIVGKLDGCYICSYDPGDVAAKIKKTLDFGKRTIGREKIRHLDEKIIAQKIIEVYNNVLYKPLRIPPLSNSVEY